MDEFDLFLTETEKIALTGCKTNKGQIEALRKIHIAFFLSASQVRIIVPRLHSYFIKKL